MRRSAAVFALLLLIAPVAARLAASASDSEAVRCALACARAGMANEKGATCCPAGHGSTIPTLASCSYDGDAVPMPGTFPMLLVLALLLILPSASRRRELVPAFALPWPPARVPDKVPLLFA